MRDYAAWHRVVVELEADATRSNRGIAAELGLSHTFVAQVRARWEADAEQLRAELDPEAPLPGPYRLPPAAPLPPGPALPLEPEGAETDRDRITALEGAVVELTALVGHLRQGVLA